MARTNGGRDRQRSSEFGNEVRATGATARRHCHKTKSGVELLEKEMRAVSLAACNNLPDLLFLVLLFGCSRAGDVFSSHNDTYVGLHV